MITPAYAPTAQAAILPKLALDFTTATLDPRVTVTRALDTATRVNSSGYIETVNAGLPRFDYDPVTLAPKGLLIEAQRTNLLLRSEEFDNAAWTKTATTVTANAATSPDGTSDADTLLDTAVAGTHAAIQTITKTASAITYAATVYAKQSTLSKGELRVSDQAGNGVRAAFDLAAGTVGSATGFGTGFTAVSSAITSAGNGWYRVTLIATSNSATTLGHEVYLADGSGSTSYTGTGAGIFLWGAQLEAGAFPTSYIPTTTTSLTRNADIVTLTGANFSSWYNASEGAFTFEYNQPFNLSGNTAMLAFTDGTNSNVIMLLTETTPRARLFIDSSGSNVANIAAGNMTLNAVNRQTSSYKVNNFRMAVNGAAPQQDASGAVPVGINQLQIGSRPTGLQWTGYARKLFYYPQALLNAELQAFSK